MIIDMYLMCQTFMIFMHLVGIISKVQHPFLNGIVYYYKVVSFNTPNYLLVTHKSQIKAFDGLFDCGCYIIDILPKGQWKVLSIGFIEVVSEC